MLGAGERGITWVCHRRATANCSLNFKKKERRLFSLLSFLSLVIFLDVRLFEISALTTSSSSLSPHVHAALAPLSRNGRVGFAVRPLGVFYSSPSMSARAQKIDASPRLNHIINADDVTPAHTRGCATPHLCADLHLCKADTTDTSYLCRASSFIDSPFEGMMDIHVYNLHFAQRTAFLGKLPLARQFLLCCLLSSVVLYYLVLSPPATAIFFPVTLHGLGVEHKISHPRNPEVSLVSVDLGRTHTYYTAGTLTACCLRTKN